MHGNDFKGYNIKFFGLSGLNSGGGVQGAGARENRGREGYGRRERKGREAEVLRGRESGEKYETLIFAFSRNERTHPNLVSQAREIEICGLQIGRPCWFLQGLWASFSCPSVTSCLLSFVASFVVFDFWGFL